MYVCMFCCFTLYPLCFYVLVFRVCCVCMYVYVCYVCMMLCYACVWVRALFVCIVLRSGIVLCVCGLYMLCFIIVGVPRIVI